MLAPVLAAALALFGIGAKSPEPSSSPTVMPSPTATPRPGNTEWLGVLWSKRYASRDGASIDLATAMAELKDAMVYGLQQSGSTPTSVGYDRKAGLLDVCFEADRSRCVFHIVLRRHDVAAPPSIFATSVAAHGLGESLAQLQREIGADRASDPRYVKFFKSSTGTVLAVLKTDKDPPPDVYDHGFQSWVSHCYVFRDGVVAAHGWMYGEN